MKILKLGQILGGSNAPSGATEFNQYSLNFDGVDDILITTKDSSIMPSDDITVGCWIQPSTWAFPGSQQVYAPFGCIAAGGYSLFFQNNFGASVTTFSGIIRVTDTGSGSAGYLFPSPGTGYSTTLRALTGWHYIALVYSRASGKASVSLDGVSLGTSSAAAGAQIQYNASNVKLMFGADAANDTIGQNFFDGGIDECSVWNAPLSDAELVAVYNGGVPIDLLTDSGDYVSSNRLQGWWRNGDTEGPSVFPTIKDLSANSNDGTMTNMDSGDIVTDVP